MDEDEDEASAIVEYCIVSSKSYKEALIDCLIELHHISLHFASLFNVENSRIASHLFVTKEERTTAIWM